MLINDRQAKEFSDSMVFGLMALEKLYSLTVLIDSSSFGRKLKFDKNVRKFRKNRSEITWGGADVVVVFPEYNTLSGNAESNFNPDSTSKTIVVSEYAAEIAWVLLELKEIYKQHINYLNKYMFYGEIAERAIQILNQTQGNTDIRCLLKEMVRESKKFL